uniref:Major facilitator superfamily (MFS) profile domain-containing protein n=1 Tax=Alexandrium catenella TaxID=2925 RepID=A0A7S1WF62_ALECA
MGMILAFLGNFTMVGIQNDWRWMLALGGALPAIALPCLLMGLALESPRFLLMNGRQKEAEAALSALVDEEEAEETLAKWSGELKATKAVAAGFLGALWPEDRLVRKALFVGIGVLVFQLASGVNLLSAYAGTVMASEVGPRNAHFAMMLIAVSRSLCCIPAVLLNDTWGRRPLLLASCTGMTIALVSLSAFYLSGLPVLPWKFVAFIFFINSFSPGLGAVSYVYAGEVMDNSVRSKGLSVAIFLARMLAAVEVLAFPAVRDHLGEGGTFLILAGFGVLTWFFLFFFAVETKGVKLESISLCFADGPSAGSCDDTAPESSHG